MTTITTAAAVAKATTILRTESITARNGGFPNRSRVALAWLVIERAASDLDPRITRRDQAITVLGLTRAQLYG